MSVFSDLSNVSRDFICEIKTTLKTGNEIWNIEHAFAAKAEFVEHVMGS